MYLRICMQTKFRQLHFRGHSTLHKIGEFYLSDHGRQPQFGQNAILARSKAKIRNWKIINCFFIYICAKPFSRTKNEGKLVLVPNSSGPLLAGLPLKFPPQWNFGLNGSLRGFRFSSGFFGNVHRKFPYHLSPFLNFRNLRLDEKLS